MKIMIVVQLLDKKQLLKKLKYLIFCVLVCQLVEKALSIESELAGVFHLSIDQASTNSRPVF